VRSCCSATSRRGRAATAAPVLQHSSCGEHHQGAGKQAEADASAAAPCLRCGGEGSAEERDTDTCGGVGAQTAQGGGSGQTAQGGGSGQYLVCRQCRCGRGKRRSCAAFSLGGARCCQARAPHHAPAHRARVVSLLQAQAVPAQGHVRESRGGACSTSGRR
jgi:hypothetical protein